MPDLEGQIALVTGASSGIGRQFARILCAHGAHVILAARRIERLQDLKNELCESGGRADAIGFDASERDAADRLIDALPQTPTILVNNAGISFAGKAHELSTDSFDEIVAVNLRTPWRLSQLCAAKWIQTARPGAIANVTSVLANRVGTGVSTYAMTKAALNHLTAAHAREWARYGIRVNALCPGYVQTEINDQFWGSDIGRAELAKLPRRRVGQPQDLSSALLFLVDPNSQFVNGASLVVDDAQGWAI